MASLFKTILRVATMLAFCVVVLGAYTRLSDAGLSCPDWPFCYGHIAVPTNEIAQLKYPYVPLESKKAWTEMLHRYAASTLGLLIITLTILAIKLKQSTKILTSTLILVIVQGLLGMWTVTLKLHPTIVMLHLLGGFTTLTLLYWASIKEFIKKNIINVEKHSKLHYLALATLVLLCLQIFLGAWTSANYAALICPDFPYCQGKWLPSLNFADAFNLRPSIGPNFFGGVLDNSARITIHMSHRLGAILTTIFICILNYKVIATYQNKLLTRLCLVITALLFGQITLGILNIVKLLPLPIAVAHNGVAVMLLLAVSTLTITLWSKTNRLANA